MAVPNHVLIIGAGGFGRNILWMLRSDAAYKKDWDIKGFLDNRTNAEGLPDVPLLGDPLTYQVEIGDIFINALGSPSARRHYTAPLLAQEADFFIARKNLQLGDRTTIGRGSIFDDNVSISVDSKIGEFVTILGTTIIGHDVKIGNYCHISNFVFIGGGAVIGNDVVIHPHATILPNIKIGNGAIIGAGSVVIGNVPDGVTVFGNPAKRFEFK
ncbi:MAG: NeuD/PglB/VioB family sugar acetyltransferase [Methylophilaceae bacterium]